MTSLKRTSLEILMDMLSDAEFDERAAVKAGDMQRQNRISDYQRAIIQEIKSRGQAGRSALERLLSHSSPELRLTGAAAVFSWKRDDAVRVLEDLVRWAEGDAYRHHEPSSVTTIALTAEMMLADHYGISITEVVPRVTGIRRPQNRDVG